MQQTYTLDNLPEGISLQSTNVTQESMEIDTQKEVLPKADTESIDEEIIDEDEPITLADMGNNLVSKPAEPPAERDMELDRGTA